MSLISVFWMKVYSRSDKCLQCFPAGDIWWPDGSSSEVNCWSKQCHWTLSGPWTRPSLKIVRRIFLWAVLPQPALIYTCGAVIRLIEALQFASFNHRTQDNSSMNQADWNDMLQAFWLFICEDFTDADQPRGVIFSFFCSYATVFSPDPTLSRENRISNFKKTSFRCNVSECRITSEQRISLVSLETHIKLIISYFTSAKQCSVFRRTLTNITCTHYELGERDTAP